MRGYIPPINDAEKLVCKKASQLGKTAIAKQSICFSKFLDERELALSVAQLNKDNINYFSFGGFENAERKVICVYDSFCEKPNDEDFPLTSLKIFCKGATALTHRDFLGAIMAIGIKRECIGDIVVNSGNSATVYALQTAKQIISEQLLEINRYKADISDSEEEITAIQQSTTEKTITVASLRFDAVLSAMLNISRAKATEMIKSNLCKVSHIPINSIHFSIQENDTVSVKGYGKYVVSNIGSLTKKNRIVISFKYFN